MNTAPVLKNNQILLREPNKSDIHDRKILGMNLECARMIGSEFDKVKEFTDDDALKWYTRCLKHPCKWIIEYSGQCIGVVGLRPISDDNKAKFSIEIYDQTLYGKGIGTEVTNLVLKYAFQEKLYHKVFLRVLDYNKRGIAVYEKCGFVIEGIDREGALIQGQYHSDIYMGILKTEYEQIYK
ncbi:MAG: GNAT family N-acetyltransferase [Clostridiales bacterium]|nr:GNAT family N-acetyltransferase [Clostridiales bacterium]